jgi:hypothetical protein
VAWSAVRVVILAAVIAGCSAAPALGDTERVWCGAHPGAVVHAGASLGISPSRFVIHKAGVEQAELDGNTNLATSLILQWVGSEMTATDADPHPNINSMPSWEADAPADFQRACLGAYGAR